MRSRKNWLLEKHSVLVHGKDSEMRLEESQALTKKSKR